MQNPKTESQNLINQKFKSNDLVIISPNPDKDGVFILMMFLMKTETYENAWKILLEFWFKFTLPEIYEKILKGIEEEKEKEKTDINKFSKVKVDSIKE